MCFLKKYSFIVVLSFLYFTPVYGFSIAPMFLDMEPVGSQSRSVMTVTNSSPHQMPVRASVSEIVLGADGQVNSVPNNSDFVIFPPQAVLQPHGQQAFRVQWRGDPALSQGKTYEITVAQILAKDRRPADGAKGTSLQLQFAMAFGSIVSMKAAVGAPNPSVGSSRLTRNKRGNLILETIISNKSNQNFLMIQADSSVTIFGANNQQLWSHTYTPDAMMSNFGLGMVQPNKSRRMKIPLPNLPENVARQAKSVKLEIRPSAK